MNMGHYLWGEERVKCFVDVHLHRIASNFEKLSKMSMLTPWKISADAHGCCDLGKRKSLVRPSLRKVRGCENLTVM